MATDTQATNMVLADIDTPRSGDEAAHRAAQVATQNRLALAVANMRQARRDLDELHRSANRSLDAETGNLARMLADGLAHDIDLLQRRMR